MTPPLTPSYKIRIARYYLSHTNLTLRQVAQHFGLASATVSRALTFYLSVIAVKPKRVARRQYEQMSYVRNDLHRFENLIY